MDPATIGLLLQGAMGLGGGIMGAMKGPSDLEKLMMKRLKEIFGIEKVAGSNIKQILATGKAGKAFTGPAVEGAAKGGAQALSSARERLARTGLLGTPLGESILAQQESESAFKTSQVESDVSMALLKALGPMIGQGGAGMPGGGAGGPDLASLMSAGGAFGEALPGLLSALGGIFGGKGKGMDLSGWTATSATDQGIMSPEGWK